MVAFLLSSALPCSVGRGKYVLALSALHVDDTRVLSSTVFIFVLQQGRILFLMALVIMR